MPVRPKDDGEEVLDLGLLDHSVDSADRAANLSSDSRDGEAGCSESDDPGMPLSPERMIVQAQDLELRASLGVSAQSRRHRAQVARKWALEIEGDGDVTDNDREREPSAEIQESDHETSLPWANRSTLHPTPLALDSKQSRTSIRGDVDHESQTLRSFLEGVEREPR